MSQWQYGKAAKELEKVHDMLWPCQGLDATIKFQRKEKVSHAGLRTQRVLGR